MNYLIIILLFLVSCTATNQQIQQDTPKIKVTTFGLPNNTNFKQTKPDFLLLQESIEAYPNMTTKFTIDIINCKSELLKIKISSSKISISPDILVLPAFGTEKIELAIQPSKKNQQDITLKFSTDNCEQIFTIKFPEIKDNNIYTIHIASFKSKEDALNKINDISFIESNISLINYELKQQKLYGVFFGLFNYSQAQKLVKNFKDFYGLDVSIFKIKEETFTKNIIK